MHTTDSTPQLARPGIQPLKSKSGSASKPKLPKPGTVSTYSVPTKTSTKSKKK